MQQRNNFVRIKGYKIKERIFQWKMSFNPGLCKQAQEVIFTCNFNKAVHPPVSYNNNPVQQVSTQKRSGPILDASLTFDELIKAIASKVKPLVCCGD